jgi:hypothetical protein
MDNDSGKPVTNADLKRELTALEDRIDGKLGALEDRLTENWRDMQTELLKAFYSFAESNQKRLTEMEREGAGIKDRLATLESRLTEVERRLNMPPAA